MPLSPQAFSIIQSMMGGPSAPTSMPSYGGPAQGTYSPMGGFTPAQGGGMLGGSAGGPGGSFGGPAPTQQQINYAVNRPDPYFSQSGMGRPGGGMGAGGMAALLQGMMGGSRPQGGTTSLSDILSGLFNGSNNRVVAGGGDFNEAGMAGSPIGLGAQSAGGALVTPGFTGFTPQRFAPRGGTPR